MSIDKTPWVSFGATWGPLGIDGPYRYRLHREWLTGDGTVVFIMLNPSTATDMVLDNTIRRCVDYAMRWGLKRLEVVNLFAFRSPKPAVMKRQADPVGPENDVAIVTACQGAKLVIAAWGIHGAHRGRDRDVRRMLKALRIPVHALHVTEDGHPGHPLFLPKDNQPIPFNL